MHYASRLLFSVSMIVGHVSSFSSTSRSFYFTKQFLDRCSVRCCRHQKETYRPLHSSSSSEDESNSVSIILETASGTKTIHGIEKGELLRSAMLKRGVSPHNGRSRLINCRGLGTCGTCAVEISCSNEGGIEPRERTTKEKLRLNFPPHGSENQSPDLRLACQVQVYDDILVKKRTGFWGQDTDDSLSEGYDAELWFGDMEYVLDSKSPAKNK